MAGDGVRTLGQCLNQSCPCDGNLIKTLDTRLNGVSYLVNTPKCQEGDKSWFHRERTQKLCVEDASCMSFENERSEGSFIRGSALKPPESALTRSG